MTNPTSTKQYVLSGGGNSVPTPISTTVTSRNGTSEFTINGLKIGRNIFGINVTGDIANGSNFSGNPPFSLTSGNFARFGGSNSTVLDNTAGIVANAFGEKLNEAFSTSVRQIDVGSSGTNIAYHDIQFTAFGGVTFQRINPSNGPNTGNPYELDSIFIENSSDVDELVMIDVTISGGSALSLFCKRKGNKYFDFFVQLGTPNAYSQYFLNSASLSDTFLTNLTALLGITAISIDTIPNSGGTWVCISSGQSLISSGPGGGGVFLDAIYV